MKILTVLVFLVISIGTDCSENVFENFKDKNISMEQVENSPQDAFYEKPQDSDYTISTKKYISDPIGRVQYMIIKKTENAPQRRKYSVAHSRAEQIIYHNKTPLKFGYSIPHRPRARPIRIIRSGPVKHIYLNLPKYIIKPPQILHHNHEIEPSGPPNHYNQHDVGQQENYFTPSVQNDFVPSNVKLNPISEFSKEAPSQEFNTVSSGYSVEGTTDHIQNNEQEFSNSPLKEHEYNFGQTGPQISPFKEHEYNFGQKGPQVSPFKEHEYNFGQKGPQISQFKEHDYNFGQKSPQLSPLKEHEYNLGQKGSQVSSFKEYEYNFGQYNGPQPNPLKLHENNFGRNNGPQSNALKLHKYNFGQNNDQQLSPLKEHENNFGQENGPQFFNNPDHSTFSPQFTSSKSEFMKTHFPQFSPDGKEQYSYEIPDEYKSLFTNNEFITNSQFNQPQISAEPQFQSSPYQNSNYQLHTSSHPQISTQHQSQFSPYQENYHVGKMRRISDISGFEPDLINMVNAALSHKHESPGNINSNEKPVHELHGAVSSAFKANIN